MCCAISDARRRASSFAARNETAAGDATPNPVTDTAGSNAIITAPIFLDLLFKLLPAMSDETLKVHSRENLLSGVVWSGVV